MAQKKCTISSDTRQASEIIAKKQKEYQALFWKYFGFPMVPRKGYKADIVANKKAIYTRKKDLKDITEKGWAARNKTNLIKKELKRLEIENKRLQKELSESIVKANILQSINKLVVGRMLKYGDSAMYDINPHVIYPAIKEYIQKQYTKPFKHLHDLDASTLGSIYNKLNKIYKKQDKAAKNYGKIGDFRDKLGIRNTMYDPASFLLESDPTMLGYDLVNKSRDLSDETFSDSAPYKNILSELLFQLRTQIENSGVQDVEKELENQVKFIHEALDGEKRNIVFQPLFQRKYNKKEKRYGFTESDQFKKDSKKYKEILNRNINNKMNEGGEIQRVIFNNKTYYYIPIKSVNSKGEEVWNAYEVPYQTTKKGNDALEKPMSKKSGNANFWIKWFSSEGLAENVNLAGRKFEGIGINGWYTAKSHKPLIGVKKNGEEFKVNALSSFELIEEGMEVPQYIWESISTIRSVLEGIKQDVLAKEKDQKEALTALVAKLSGKKFKSKMTRGELDKVMNDILGIDMNMNIAVSDGKVVTTNDYFSEVEDYVPYMYSDTDIILGLMHAHEALENKIAQYNLDLHAARESKDIKEGIKIKHKIKKNTRLLSIFDDKLQVALGMKSASDSPPLDVHSMIQFFKHRSGFMSPLPVRTKDGKGFKTYGRRKDWGVFSEYADRMFSQSHRNALKIDTLNTVAGTTKITSDYILDHVKRSLGSLDVESGVFNWRYSDAGFARLLGKIGIKATPEQLYYGAKIHSLVISGGLLKYTSALANNMQRLSLVIERGITGWHKAHRFASDDKTKKIAEEIANLAGTTDTVTALADTLLSAAGEGESPQGLYKTGGYRHLIDLTKIKWSRRKFVKFAMGDKAWNSMMEELMTRIDPKIKIDAGSLLNLYEGIWEASHGISNLDPQKKKYLKKTLSKIMTKDKINKYVGWSLSGGYIAQASGFEGLAFMPVEKQMRIEATMQGAMAAVEAGIVSQEDIEKHSDDPYWKYKQPEVLKFARIYVYNTMFGMSPAYLPKMFGGAVGTTLWKFKPYQWHQMRNEYRTMTNWWNQQKSKPNLIANLISPKSELDKKARDFLLYRGSMSAMTTFLFYTPVVGAMAKKFTQLFGNPLLTGAMQRGGESVILSAAFRTMSLLMVSGNLFDEEEDKIYQEWYRTFFPMALNMVIDTISEGDPFKFIGLYHKSAPGVIKAARDYISD